MQHVIVLHDWFCDHTSWDPLLPYLSTDRFTYTFPDLRGYGVRRNVTGEYTLDEAVADVIAEAPPQFSLVGHSMSTVVVQRILQLIPDRVTRAVLVTPVGPAGMGMDAEGVNFFKSLARATDEERFATMAPMWGNRLSDTWIKWKLLRWRETSEAEAVAKYVELWGCTDISQAAHGISTPMLVIAGAHDAPPFQPDALRASLLPYYPNAEVVTLSESGHYPMQEQPPLLATVIERCL
jgi:pimeloyl-ACP methyl ester carboxylesterase